MPAERRITLRVLAYWEKLRRGRAMPREAEVRAEDIGDIWDSCFIMAADGNYRHIGQSVAASLLDADRLTNGVKEVMRTGKPLLDEGEFSIGGLELVKYRQCLLPLGEGDSVGAILGGVRFRIFPRVGG